MPFAAIWIIVGRPAGLRIGSQTAIGDGLVAPNVQPCPVTENIPALCTDMR